MKWIKLHVEDILYGSTISELDNAERGVWFMLLLLAGHGRNPGIIEMREGEGWEHEMLAKFIRVDPEFLSSTIGKLLAVGKLEEVPNNQELVRVSGEYSRYRVKNWDKYQTTYEKQKGLHEHAGPDREGDIDRDKYSSPFSRFWFLYPRREGKAEAWKAWKKLRPSGSLINQIISAVKWQRETQQWKKDGGQFVPYPATYLNRRRWEDEEPVQPKKEEHRGFGRTDNPSYEDFNDEYYRQVKEFNKPQEGELTDDAGRPRVHDTDL